MFLLACQLEFNANVELEAGPPFCDTEAPLSKFEWLSWLAEVHRLLQFVWLGVLVGTPAWLDGFQLEFEDLLPPPPLFPPWHLLE